MAKEISKRIFKIVNLILLTICIINSGDVIYRLVDPELPTIRKYVTNLKDIEFPLSFRICLNHIWDNNDRYLNLGVT